VVIGGQSDTIVARIALPGLGSVLSAAGNEDAGLVYLGTYTGSADHVATVSVQVDSVVAAVIIGREPWGIACFEPSGLVYCASARTDEVRVLTGDGAGILTTLPVGDAPYVFAAVPRHNRLYLGHLNTRYVYVLRDTSAGIAEPQSPRLEISGALSVSSNPFRGAVRVQVRTEPNSARMPTEVEVCATTGRVVRRLQLGQRVNGASCAVWDGRDFAQVPVPAGVYLVTTNSGDCLKVVKAQ
jgi:DNA-binding beta-propeller fold protein YncE